MQLRMQQLPYEWQQLPLQEARRAKWLTRAIFTASERYLGMNNIKITVLRKADYKDLQEQYENPIEHTCSVLEGQQWISINGTKPDGLCDSAWESMRWFVEELAAGHGNFYDGWMKNPNSAMISCNDGFRPVSFLIETA